MKAMEDKCRISVIETFIGPLTQWQFKSCLANFGEGEDWATLYEIHSAEEGKGHATTLLATAKRYYEEKGKRFGSSVALNDRMRHLLQKLAIHEYTNMEEELV